MKKMRVQWTPDLDQDLDSITTKCSPFYDEELTNQLITDYGSIENFKQSDKYKEMKGEINNP
jgi:hypothetical protein